MATKTYTFSGPVRWAKVWAGQCDRKFATETRGGRWGLIMNLNNDDEQIAKWNSLGLARKVVTEDDITIANLKAKAKGKNPPDIQLGDIPLNRDEKHPKMGYLGPPAVLGVEEGTSIGNGSLCTVTVDVYPYTFEGKPGNAARLATVTVDKLVEFKPEQEGPPVG